MDSPKSPTNPRSLPVRALRGVRNFCYKYWMTLCALTACAGVAVGVPQITHIFSLPVPDFSGRSAPREVAAAVLLWVFVGVLPLAYAWALIRGVFPNRPIEVVHSPPHGLAARLWWYLRHLSDIPAELASRLRLWPAVIAGGACVLLGAALLVRLLSIDALSDADSGLSLSRHLGCILLAVGVWLAAGKAINAQAWRFAGRMMFFLILFGLLGEILWSLAQDGRMFGSFRLCTIWAVYHSAFLVLAFAFWVDQWQTRSRLPVRAAAVGALIGLALTFGPARIGAMQAAPIDGKWIERLQQRLAALPRDEPVVLVAASGGGSRAALFTALVYEALASETIEVDDAPRPYNVADHIAIVSSVSGGSLATAYYTARVGQRGKPPSEGIPWERDLAELQSSMRGHLAVLIEQEVAKLRGSADQAQDDAIARKVMEESGPVPASPPEAPWILQSRFVDDMCTDFMAPLLRAMLLPGSARGVAVERFWKKRFQWPDSPYLTPYVPLVLYNACEVDTGTQVVIGDPPLPADFFATGDGTKSASETIAALADYNPRLAVTRSEAVRASANFPWGFEIATIGRARAVEVGRPAQSDEPIHLIDGGVYDNTGVATLRCVIEGLVAKTGSTQRDARLAKSVLDGLRTRGVILLQIDSGAKRTKPGLFTRLLGGTLEPVQALNNAAYVNADFATRQHIEVLEKVFTEVRDGEAVPRLYPLCIQCNHEENVMTAWALGPRDKAKVIARFLTEIAIARKNFKAVLAKERDLAGSDKDTVKAKVRELTTLREQIGRASELRRMRDRGQAVQMPRFDRQLDRIAPAAPPPEAAESMAK